MTDRPALALERGRDVAHLVLDRPPRNEMDGRFFEDLARIVERELPGLDAAGLVVRGRARHFSSGADVAALVARIGSGGAGARTELERNAASFLALARLSYPVVAAIGGCCFGSGLELALACGFRIATRGALMSMPESQLGLVPGCGGVVRLVDLLGPGRAAELTLSGRMVDSSEALAMGLVDGVVDRRDLVAGAERLVLSLAGAPGARAG